MQVSHESSPYSQTRTSVSHRDYSRETYYSKHVIAATGSFQRPYMPDIEGRQNYKGEILHSLSVTSFTSTGVVWADGQLEDVDAVIFSTGYRDHVPYLKELGALDAHDTPLHRAGVSTIVNGLYYLGLMQIIRTNNISLLEEFECLNLSK